MKSNSRKSSGNLRRGTPGLAAWWSLIGTLTGTRNTRVNRRGTAGSG
jgi:hypothetical protein